MNSDRVIADAIKAAQRLLWHRYDLPDAMKVVRLRKICPFPHVQSKSLGPRGICLQLWIYDHPDTGNLRNGILEKLQALTAKFGGYDLDQPCDVAARMRQAGDEPFANRIL